jgi:DNA-binding transcriptional LysR family regulator
MDLATLRCFVAVAEDEHVGRAALRLNISASPLSRQIRKLEAELGVALFERERQRLRLTEAGRRFMAEARDLLGHAETVRARGRGLAQGAAGSLCLGAVPGALSNDTVLAALRHLSIQRPGVALRVVPGRSPALVEQVLRGALDLALVYRPPGESGLETRLLARRPMVLVVAADHPLATAELGPDVLGRQPWVALDREASPAFRLQFLAACRSAGFEPDIRFETSDLFSSLAVVQAGLACAVVQEGLPLPAGMAVRRLPGFELSTELYAVWRSSNPARALADLLARLQPVSVGAPD